MGFQHLKLGVCVCVTEYAMYEMIETIGNCVHVLVGIKPNNSHITQTLNHPEKAKVKIMKYVLLHGEYEKDICASSLSLSLSRSGICRDEIYMYL